MYWQGSHVEGGCCYFTCLQRAEKGPVWTNFKEASFRNLSLGLELLIKGCLGKKHLFLFLVVPSLRLGAKPSLIWSKDSALGASRPKTFSRHQPCDFMSPDSYSPSTRIVLITVDQIFLFEMTSNTHTQTHAKLQFSLVLQWTIVRKVRLQADWLNCSGEM